MTDEKKILIVLVGSGEDMMFQDIGIIRVGFPVPFIGTPDELRPRFNERGVEVDLLYFEIDGPGENSCDDILALVNEFSPLCPNAKILVSGGARHEERFSGLDRVTYHACYMMAPSILGSKARELLEDKLANKK